MTAAVAIGGLSVGTAATPASPAVSIAAAHSASAVRGIGTASLVTVGSVAHTTSVVTTRYRRHRVSPLVIAWRMMHWYRWKALKQFRYLRWLWNRESSWNVYAYNPYSGAYGIPQALPGWKMATAGSNWRSSAATQIRWGMRYIRSHYGTPYRAWVHECYTGWY
ncbi:MAG TPA: lytic transglycosylase domain-containing protein [Streptosporangiaceae bacterium]|nr:lytic transglycosylase domain-containing protein [Streptosporangiaceae bacterium]